MKAILTIIACIALVGCATTTDSIAMSYRVVVGEVVSAVPSDRLLIIGYRDLYGEVETDFACMFQPGHKIFVRVFADERIDTTEALLWSSVFADADSHTNTTDRRIKNVY